VTDFASKKRFYQGRALEDPRRAGGCALGAQSVLEEVELMRTARLLTAVFPDPGGDERRRPASEREEVDMTDKTSPARISNLTDVQLLNLYLSLSAASREKIFVNTAQAANITGVSRRTIQFWIECGAVRAIVIGGKYRIVLESLRGHLRSQIEKRTER
jgi:excisionase family DNA binding protein